MNVPSFIRNTQMELLSCEMECTASPIRDNNFHSLQLQAVRFNGLCTMEMVKAPVETVSTLGSESDRLRSDNAAFKLPLQDIGQELTSSATTHSVVTKAYRDICLLVGVATMLTRQCSQL
jgi:hypothetical protein